MSIYVRFQDMNKLQAILKDIDRKYKQFQLHKKGIDQ